MSTMKAIFSYLLHACMHLFICLYNDWQITYLSLHSLDDRSHDKQQLMLNEVLGVTGRVMTEPMGFWKVLGNSFNPRGVSATTRDRNPITLTSISEGRSRTERELKNNLFRSSEFNMFD